jgi:hypothetical protein
MNVAVKTEALSIFALLLSAPGGFLPLDKDLSWTSRKFRAHRQTETTGNSGRSTSADHRRGSEEVQASPRNVKKGDKGLHV